VPGVRCARCTRGYQLHRGSTSPGPDRCPKRDRGGSRPCRAVGGVAAGARASPIEHARAHSRARGDADLTPYCTPGTRIARDVLRRVQEGRDAAPMQGGLREHSPFTRDAPAVASVTLLRPAAVLGWMNARAQHSFTRRPRSVASAAGSWRGVDADSHCGSGTTGGCCSRVSRSWTTRWR